MPHSKYVVAAVGEASAEEAAVAVGSGLGEPAAAAVAAYTAFNLPMCFLCFFFNLPTVGQSPTSGRFFF
jgi:hypothetical protein